MSKAQFTTLTLFYDSAFSASRVLHFNACLQQIAHVTSHVSKNTVSLVIILAK